MKFTTLIALIGVTNAIEISEATEEQPITELAEQEPVTDLAEEELVAELTEDEPVDENLAEENDEEEEPSDADETLAEQDDEAEEEPATDALAEQDDQEEPAEEDLAEQDEEEEPSDEDLAEIDEDDSEEEPIELAETEASGNGKCSALPAKPDWTLKRRGKHSGCGNYRGQRGRMRDVGKHLSLQQCIAKCDAAGPKVCKNIEHGGRAIGQNCRLWSGTCRVGGWRQRRVDSNIYERTGPAKPAVNDVGDCPKGASHCFDSKDGTKYATYTKSNIRGGNLGGSIKNSSNEHCADMCDKTKGCTAADFYPATKKCWLNKTPWSIKPKNLRSMTRSNAVYKLPAQYQGAPCPKGATECFVAKGEDYAQYNGKDVRGGDIKRVGHVSRQQCAERCTTTHKCESADYNPKSKNCWLTITPWAPVPKTRNLSFINSIWHVPGEVSCDGKNHHQCRSEHQSCFWEPASTPAVDAAFKKFDRNKDGELTWREVRTGIRKEYKKNWRSIRHKRRAANKRRYRQQRADKKAVSRVHRFDRSQKRGDINSVRNNARKTNRRNRNRNRRENSKIRRDQSRNYRKVKRDFKRVARKSGDKNGKINKAELVAAWKNKR